MNTKKEMEIPLINLCFDPETGTIKFLLKKIKLVKKQSTHIAILKTSKTYFYKF
jgi:hypothetical protein